MSLNEQQLEHIKSWQASGFSQTVYCQKNGLNKKTFSGWFKSVSRRAVSRQQTAAHTQDRKQLNKKPHE